MYLFISFIYHFASVKAFKFIIIFVNFFRTGIHAGAIFVLLLFYFRSSNLKIEWKNKYREKRMWRVVKNLASYRGRYSYPIYSNLISNFFFLPLFNTFIQFLTCYNYFLSFCFFFFLLLGVWKHTIWTIFSNYDTNE